jgi:uncharacterized protein YidB (DUF937 family)
MGLLDQIVGGAMRGGMGGAGRGGMAGGMGGPLAGPLGGVLGGMLGGGARGGMGNKLAMGVLVALLVKAARDHSRPAEGRSFDSNQGAGGGLGGLGGLLGGLGGAGALGGLIGQLQQRGLSQQANSWVGSGHNEQVTPHQLADALGDDTIQALEQQTGMPREALLSELARELPEAVHQATPSGQLPNDQDLHRLVGG